MEEEQKQEGFHLKNTDLNITASSSIVITSDDEAPLMSLQSIKNMPQNNSLPLFDQKRLAQLENNKRALRKLVWVVLITTFFVAVEIAGGLFSNSIAIISDAAHLTSDAFGIGISIVALKIAERSSNDEHTFGYHRAEVLGALVSILFIWLITVWLMVEATYRFMDPPKIDSEIMLIASCICLVFNLI